MWCAHWGCALGGVRGVARRVCVVFLCVLVSSIKCSSVEAVLAFPYRFIDIRYHYARWCAQQGIVRFEWISSRANIADMFTKGLKTDVFVDHAQHLVSTAGSTS